MLPHKLPPYWFAILGYNPDSQYYSFSIRFWNAISDEVIHWPAPKAEDVAQIVPKHIPVANFPFYEVSFDETKNIFEIKTVSITATNPEVTPFFKTIPVCLNWKYAYLSKYNGREQSYLNYAKYIADTIFFPKISFIEFSNINKYRKEEYGSDTFSKKWKIQFTCEMTNYVDLSKIDLKINGKQIKLRNGTASFRVLPQHRMVTKSCLILTLDDTDMKQIKKIKEEGRVTLTINDGAFVSDKGVNSLAYTPSNTINYIP